MPNEKDILASWTAPEYQHFEKTGVWYFGLFGLSGLLILWSILSKNYLFTLIVAMATVIIYMLNQKGPQTLKITITPDGVKINDRLFSFDEDLKKFWVIYKPTENVKTLNLDQKGLRPTLVLQLENQNPLAIREILLKYLEEDVNREEGGIDKLGRALGL